MANVAQLLSFIKNKKLKERGNEIGEKRPNFSTGSYKGQARRRNRAPPSSSVLTPQCLDQISLQQSDLLRDFYMEKAENGLGTTCLSKKVIIVGAGIAGLVAGYELLRAGHTVEILEMTQRFGGRIKTLDEKDGFDRGLHSDAGAMRIPNPPTLQDLLDLNIDRANLIVDKAFDIHYLTDHYIRTTSLTEVPFNNSDNNAYLQFYNCDRMTIKEWNRDAKNNFDALWCGWDATLIKNSITDITTIGAYYDRTINVVTEMLYKRLKDIPINDICKRAAQWKFWVHNWGQMTVDGFLRSNYEAIKELVVLHNSTKVNTACLDDLNNTLPWPEEAITAYSVFNYTGGLDGSLAASLVSRLGKYGTYGMHSVDGGLSEIPKAIVNQNSNLKSSIVYNRTVDEVEYGTFGGQKITIRGIFTNSGESFVTTGDAVIITVPLNIMRQIAIKGPSGDEFPIEFQQAIEDVNYQASTKIMLQYKERFWDRAGGDRIKGGFSKTNLPIGQVHYPTNIEVGPASNRKGILLVYTWKSEALLFGSLPEHVAVREAVNQIDRTIHPKSKDFFETGRVQAWYSDPAAQGAYAHLKPKEDLSVNKLMLESWNNVYFAGEALSFTNGWIQGALESALRTAYQFYTENELNVSKRD